MAQRPPHDTTPPGRSPAAAPDTHDGDLRQALLASLGLPRDATPEGIEAAHDRVVRYLADAPAELEGWARQQAVAADAAHAVLTGKAGDVLSRRATRATPVAAAAPASRKPLALRIATNPLVLIALVAALLVGVYKFGGSGAGTEQAKPAVAMGEQADGSGAGAAATATPTPVDPAKVKALEEKVAANPQDANALAQLGDLYFDADEFTKAAATREKIAALRPNDTDVMLTTGLAYFNAGQLTKAEQWWDKTVKADPKKAEAYYDLGFLYVSKNPPDTAKAQQMWEKVVELKPNSDLAQKVQNHMSALVTPAPTPPAGTPAPTSPK